jgi:hypothetical protein
LLRSLFRKLAHQADILLLREEHHSMSRAERVCRQPPAGRRLTRSRVVHRASFVFKTFSTNLVHKSRKIEDVIALHQRHQDQVCP